MPDFTVHQHGTDSSGRAIYATAYMWAWWEEVVADLGFRPTVVQGAFMTRNGGGAAASAGYHDDGGCFDLRTRDLSAAQVDRTVRALRSRGAAAWRRDARHGGMDPHIHFVLGTDSPLAAGAASQWTAYRGGHDGLAGGGADYEWRPAPLVLRPPDDMPPYADWDRASRELLADDVVAAVLGAPVGGQADPATLRQAVNQIRTAGQRA
jgi:hypothetical protein